MYHTQDLLTACNMTLLLHGKWHKQIVKYYTSMSLVFYSISRRASLRESKQNQQEVHDQEVEAEAEAVSKKKKKKK